MSDTATTAPARLELDVWLDVACPFCVVGEKRLNQVIETLPFKGEVDVRFHSFQLNPDAPERTTQTQAEYLASRGMDPARLEASHRHLDQQAGELGFSFDHDAVVPVNTFTAHRMIQAAAAEGVQEQVVDALFTGYFSTGLDVGDADALRAAVVGAGLSEAAADRVLADPDAFAAEVNDDIAQARSLGIQGVPFYVIDGRYGVSGAQPAPVFEKALTQVYDELNPKPALQTLGTTPDGEVCGPDGCAV